ncbi:hypothetical protein KIW84_070952 [Lathyrus oleraceus]|uniref:Thaumatin-like protein n=1 Tax=Pisum sativum TaxID=3888 RepID=A0A9D4VJA5_PEA|nr:hypothetical protein KIW84_070952 [Pisum sativum]
MRFQLGCLYSMFGLSLTAYRRLWEWQLARQCKSIPAGTSSGRIWGRTGCNFDGSGRGSCQTGDCGGALSCSLSGQPPLTLAEFTLNGGNNQDYFDLSVIDGFNIPMQFAPTSNGCNKVRTCREKSCPDAYQYPSDDTKTVSCPGGTNYRIVFCP